MVYLLYYCFGFSCSPLANNLIYFYINSLDRNLFGFCDEYFFSQSSSLLTTFCRYSSVCGLCFIPSMMCSSFGCLNVVKQYPMFLSFSSLVETANHQKHRTINQISGRYRIMHQKVSHELILKLTRFTRFVPTGFNCRTLTFPAQKFSPLLVFTP